MPTPARVAAAAVIGVLLVGGAFAYLGRPNQPVVGAPGPAPTLTAAPTPTSSPAASASPAAAVDYSTLPGRILAEHLGNAIDGSEMPTTDYHPDRRRFYFMDPATMTGATAVEFLPNQPTTGKTAADVSSDGKKVVFQDFADKPKLYEANLDGTGFHQIPIECDCGLLYPDYDPTATKIVYVRIEGGEELAGDPRPRSRQDHETRVDRRPRERRRPGAAGLVARRQDHRLQPPHLGERAAATAWSWGPSTTVTSHRSPVSSRSSTSRLARSTTCPCQQICSQVMRTGHRTAP